MSLTWPDDFINKVICGDCLEILPQIPDGAVDAVITDPPYGIDRDTNYPTSKKVRGNHYPRVIGDDRPFDPSHLIRAFYNKPMFIFGSNYFHRQLPQSGAWLIWDKTGGGIIKNNNADAELVWSNLDFAPRIYHLLWNGFTAKEVSEPRQHPTQKPVELMCWIVGKWTKPDDLILDAYCGSGSTLVAAKQLGRRYIGIEIEPKYCKIAEERLKQEILL